MSKLCIGIINKQQNIEFNNLKESIMTKISNYNLGVFFQLSYCEPFIEHYIDDDIFIFSIADNFIFDNCEMLFLPDNDSFAGKKNELSFIERMRQLSCVFELVLENVSKFDIFIGESGTDYCEFAEYSICVEDFASIANEFLNLSNSSNIHLTIEKTAQKNTVRRRTQGTQD